MSTNIILKKLLSARFKLSTNSSTTFFKLKINTQVFGGVIFEAIEATYRSTFFTLSRYTVATIPFIYTVSQ